jgi:hypothetical protein
MEVFMTSHASGRHKTPTRQELKDTQKVLSYIEAIRPITPAAEAARIALTAGSYFEVETYLVTRHSRDMKRFCTLSPYKGESTKQYSERVEKLSVRICRFDKVQRALHRLVIAESRYDVRPRALETA